MNITSNQAAWIGAFGGATLGGLIGVVGSIFVARYAIKHGPNYEEQIDGLDEKFEGLHETIGKLAETQEKLRLQQEAQVTVVCGNYESANRPVGLRLSIANRRQVILRTYLKAGRPDWPSVIDFAFSESDCSAIRREATFSTSTIAFR